jgi:hypothetical protein
MMQSHCIHIVEHGAQTKHHYLPVVENCALTRYSLFIYLFFEAMVQHLLTEAGAATELYHCRLHNKFIHEYFKVKAYSHLTHSSLLPLCTIQAFFIK